MKNDDAAYPCGLIAKYMFDDTYMLYDNTSSRVTIDESNIAHSVDRDYKFKHPLNGNASQLLWRDVEDCKVI